MWDTSLTPALYGGASHLVAPTKLFASLCISMFQGYWYVIWGIFPFVQVGGCFPSIEVLGGISTCDVHMLILVHFVVHYVSCFYYGYDYSSSYGDIFWPVISFISDCGTFPDGVSSKLGSVWDGSTTTFDAKRLWRCYWLCLCATDVH